MEPERQPTVVSGSPLLRTPARPNPAPAPAPASAVPPTPNAQTPPPQPGPREADTRARSTGLLSGVRRQASAPYEAPDDYNRSVSGHLNSLLGENSLYMQRATQRANQQSNERGLLSSSLAVGAAHNAAIESALPIAQQDAKYQQDTGLQYNQYDIDAARSAQDYTEASSLQEQANREQLQQLQARFGYDTQARDQQQRDALEKLGAEASYQLQSQLGTSTQNIQRNTSQQIQDIMSNEGISGDVKERMINDVLRLHDQHLQFSTSLYTNLPGWQTAFALNPESPTPRGVITGETPGRDLEGAFNQGDAYGGAGSGSGTGSGGPLAGSAGRSGSGAAGTIEGQSGSRGTSSSGGSGQSLGDSGESRSLNELSEDGSFAGTPDFSGAFGDAGNSDDFTGDRGVRGGPDDDNGGLFGGVFGGGGDNDSDNNDNDNEGGIGGFFSGLFN